MKYKIVKFMLLISKIFAITISLFIIVIFVGEFDILTIKKMSIYEVMLLLLIPSLYTIGSLFLIVREYFGSILMFFSVIFFNIISYIIEKRFDDFDFFILLIPAIIVILTKMYVNKKLLKRKTYSK